MPWISGAALVLANLVPVGYVVFQGRGVYYVLVLFWLENVVIGAFNVLRMIVCANPLPFEKPLRELVKSEKGARIAHVVQKCFVIPFFAAHYGIFTGVHGMFVFAIGGGAFAGGTGLSGDFHLADLTTPLLALIGSHTVSFVTNYLMGGEYRRTNLAVLMARPYGRVVVLHVTIIFGAFVVMLSGQHAGAVLLLLALKIGMDLRAHISERRKLASPE